MFEQGASCSQFAHILRVRERQFSPGAILHGCRGLQHALHVWLEVKLLAAYQDLHGERQRFEKGTIPRDHEFLFFLRRERVVGGGDLKNRPVLMLHWIGWGGGRTQAEHIVCNVTKTYKLRLDAAYPGLRWEGECV